MKTKFSLVFALITALAFVLVSCARIPTSGPVGESDAHGVDRDSITYNFTPDPPRPGASPEEIVRGFINAGTGPTEDYKVAREHLAHEVASEWNAVDRTVVYQGEPSIVRGKKEGQYIVQLEVYAEINSEGIMTKAKQNTTRALNFTVAKVEGENRITAAPSGTMVHFNQFSVLFSSQKLYFFDPTMHYLVPDLRWFVNRKGLAAAVVNALLKGPAPYLKSAVTSAFPQGAKLSRSAIPIDEGRAIVDFAADVFQDTSATTRQRMHLQLLSSLNQISSVQEVTMTNEQHPVDLGQPDPSHKLAELDPNVGSSQVGIFRQNLVYFEGSQPVKIAGLASAKDLLPTHPAMNVAGSSFAFLNKARTKMYTISAEKVYHEAATGKELTPPSVDPFDWVWTASGTGSGASKVFAAKIQDAFEPTKTLDAPWLGKKTVKALRISADGARAAVVVGQGEQSRLYIAGVIRDSEGTPRGLATPIEVPTQGGINSVIWASETKLIVAELSPTERVTARIVGLNFEHEDLRPLLGMTNISTGPGEDSVYAETKDAVYLRVGSSWRGQDTSVRQLRFPG